MTRYRRDDLCGDDRIMSLDEWSAGSKELLLFLRSLDAKNQSFMTRCRQRELEYSKVSDIFPSPDGFGVMKHMISINCGINISLSCWILLDYSRGKLLLERSKIAPNRYSQFACQLLPLILLGLVFFFFYFILRVFQIWMLLILSSGKTGSVLRGRRSQDSSKELVDAGDLDRAWGFDKFGLCRCPYLVCGSWLHAITQYSQEQ